MRGRRSIRRRVFMFLRSNGMDRATLVWLALILAASALAIPREDGFRGWLLAVSQVDHPMLQAAKAQGIRAILLNLSEEEEARAAARAIQAAGLDLYYWIEVGRNPRLADAHPEWMASLQGHPEWRRHFPNAPTPQTGEVIKNYPWVPVMYQEAFDAHKERV